MPTTPTVFAEKQLKELRGKMMCQWSVGAGFMTVLKKKNYTGIASKIKYRYAAHI